LFLELLNSDEVLATPRHDIFFFTHNDFAPFSLTKKPEFLEKKVKCGASKIQKFVVMYRCGDRIERRPPVSEIKS
jgi:hypothetical protein